MAEKAATKVKQTLVNIIVDSVIDSSVTLAVPDYDSFKQGNMLNSTEAPMESVDPEMTKALPNYKTPKTQLALESRSRSRLVGRSGSSKLSTPRSSSKHY